MTSWEERLFAVLDDLEQQAEALFEAERAAELVDRSRAEYASVTLASRLVASAGREVGLGIAGVGRVSGELRRVGAGWVLVSGAGGDWVVHLAAVEEVVAASSRSVPEVAWSPLTRLGLGSTLRGLSELGEPCVVHLRSGSRAEGRVLRVGADFLEVEVAPGRVRVVAFAAVAAVRSR